jgi:hypothetical protein
LNRFIINYLKIFIEDLRKWNFKVNNKPELNFRIRW